MMPRGLFVTGTDTGVGKTLIAAALITRHASLGRRVAAMKPVASGSEPTAQGLRNPDALLLASRATVKSPYDQTNPYVFGPAIAPHLAAEDAGIRIDPGHLATIYGQLAAAADVVIVEGAGGWRVPLGPSTYISDLPEQLGLGVVLVVGLRLGCLNHALLTAEAIGRSGKVPLLGWIGNGIDPGFEWSEQNVLSLKARLAAPCWGIVPPLGTPDPDRAAEYLEFIE